MPSGEKNNGYYYSSKLPLATQKLLSTIIVLICMGGVLTGIVMGSKKFKEFAALHPEFFEKGAEDTNEQEDVYTDTTPETVFYDVQGTWAEEAVTYLAERGIVSGVSDNMFGADNNITRGQFVTMLVRMLEIKMGVETYTQNTMPFSDVSADAYYSEYLTKAKSLGIASGYEGNTFRPDNTIARQDMFTFTERALNVFGAVEDAENFDIYNYYTDSGLISAYAVPSIRNLTAAGIVTGSNNTISPMNLAKRNEAAQMLYNVIKYIETEEPKLKDNSYILPNSATEYVTEDRLRQLPITKTNLAACEIYARHGVIFGDGDVQDYFEDQVWYTPVIHWYDFNDDELSEVEKYNYSAIREIEDRRKNGKVR